MARSPSIRSRDPRRPSIRRAWNGLLAGLLTASAAAQDWTPLHLETFQQVSGPQGVTGPPVSVDWCRVEGARAGSGFCPTGAAWRLDPGDELVATIRPEPGCGRLRVWVYASALDAVGSWMRLGGPVGCGQGGGVTVGVPASGGACLDLAVESETEVDGRLQWTIRNAGATVLLIDEWFLEGAACADEEAHDCCTAGGPGCDDPQIAACVCEADPFCCDVAWDQFCVDRIEADGCGTCSPSCGGGLETDFGTTYVPGGVCAALPSVFESCSGTGPHLTTSGGCAGPGDAALRFGGGYPWSSVRTRCVDLTAAQSARLSCEVWVAAGVPGPVIEATVGAESPIELVRVPISGEAGCRRVEVDLAAVVGRADVRFRLRSGSSVADATRLDDLKVELDPSHGPCVPGGPAVDDPEVQACTCAIDDYCCTVAWDDLCITAATLLCDAGCEGLPVCGSGGPCDEVRSLPACDDEACCEQVCRVDPFCCLSAWDAACVASAEACGRLDPDLDGDGDVDGADLGLLLSAWARIDAADADLDGDGVVGGGDLGLLLAAWTGP